MGASAGGIEAARRPDRRGCGRAAASRHSTDTHREYAGKRIEYAARREPTATRGEYTRTRAEDICTPGRYGRADAGSDAEFIRVVADVMSRAD